MNIALPVLIVGGLGLLFGVVLTVASIVMHVPTDERVEQITALLPGANCGGCGYPGCSGYAAAIVQDGAPLTLCAPSGDAVKDMPSSAMGVDSVDVTRGFAVNLCQGTTKAAAQRFQYAGIPTCAAANAFYGGNLACPYGCLGLGDCAAACQFNAIAIVDGVARIDINACTDCGACLKACPKNLIHRKEERGKAIVLCSSHSKGKETRAACKNGCIACGRCVKVCPEQAIAMENNLARIDQALCTACGKCVEVCPTNCIAMVPR